MIAGMDEQLIIALGRVIRERRSALRHSQGSFAETVGLHKTYIGSIERGERNISLKNLIRISAALDMPPSSLIAAAEGLEI